MSDYKNIITNLSNSINVTNLKSVGMYSGSFFMLCLVLQFFRMCFRYLPSAVFYFLFYYLSTRVYGTMSDSSVNDKLNNLVFVCSYDVIVLYSKLQILCKKINDKLLKNMDYEENIKKTIYKLFNIPETPVNKYVFEYIKHDDVVNKTMSLNKNLISESSYDFIILSNESTKHKKIIQKDDVDSLNSEIDVDLLSIEMIPSNIKFMVFQLYIPYLTKSFEIKQGLLDLQLKSEKCNFLIDNNIIDKKFLLYFVNNYYSNKTSKIYHLDGCEIHFIDGAVNMISMKLDEQYLHLYENTYEIKNVDTTNNLDPVNNFVESDEEYEITNNYVLSSHIQDSANELTSDLSTELSSELSTELSNNSSIESSSD